MTVVLAYFAYLAAMGGMARLKAGPASSANAVLGGSILVMGSVLTIGMPHVMPLIYLLIGYWLPAMLVRAPNLALEQRLLGLDHRLFGFAGLESFANTAPRPLLEYLELAYLCCYAVVPLGFAWLVFAGFQEDVSLFWSTVLLASFACYGLLPWLPSRAPRAVERPAGRPRSSIRVLNLVVLDRASVQWNTFPSGHTAASVATALAVGSSAPLAGTVLMLIAVSIAAGSVFGRYHYAADAIAGALVAVVAFLTATAAHAL
jgi:membrane-associated phospholipid phosphatase